MKGNHTQYQTGQEAQIKLNSRIKYRENAFNADRRT